MARKVFSADAVKKTNGDAATSWPSIKWEDLEKWAGDRSVARGQTYQRQGQVTRLALAEDGRLLATVEGSKRYFVTARIVSTRGRSRQLESTCSCPVGVSCKHAVAMIVDYLAALAKGRDVAVARPDDPRWSRILDPEVDGYELDEFDDDRADVNADEEGRDDAGDDAVPQKKKKSTQSRGKAGAKRRTRVEWDAAIKADLEAKSREQLVALTWSLVDRFPELRQEFQERLLLAEGDGGRLVAEARRELRSVTAELGWRNHWKGEGHTPNYSRLRHRLERLVELGHADGVVELGRELLELGMEQVGESNDEGETAMELASCLTVIFEAVAKSSLSAAEKIEYAVDACLADDYGVLDDEVNSVLDVEWAAADWSSVADRLAQRLGEMPRNTGEEKFTTDYRRNQLSNFLLDALQRAGRSDELLSVYEAEARETCSYERLVRYLIGERRYEDAERWAREGIEKTHAKWPGIAAGLAKSMCELARRRKQWEFVAAHVAGEFFAAPSPQSFDELMTAATKAKCFDAVRAGALQFLESGRSPIRIAPGTSGAGKTTVDSDWPLPMPDYLLPLLSGQRWQTEGPHFNVLLQIAIGQKRPDEVLHWYEKIAAAKMPSAKRQAYWGDAVDVERVAQAIVAAYPDRALEIYRRKLDAYLPQANGTAYEICGACLRQMRSIYKSLDQLDHWDELLADIRHNYRNRPRFMEVLNKLAGRTILDSHKATGRR